MQDFNTAGGRIIEIRRYVTPLGLYGQDARRERWELWIKTPNGSEESWLSRVARCQLGADITSCSRSKPAHRSAWST